MEHMGKGFEGKHKGFEGKGKGHEHKLHKNEGDFHGGLVHHQNPLGLEQLKHRHWNNLTNLEQHRQNGSDPILHDFSSIWLKPCLLLFQVKQLSLDFISSMAFWVIQLLKSVDACNSFTNHLSSQRVRLLHLIPLPIYRGSVRIVYDNLF